MQLTEHTLSQAAFRSNVDAAFEALDTLVPRKDVKLTFSKVKRFTANDNF